MTVVNSQDWFNNISEETAEPNAFGFDDGVTSAILTDVSLFESKNSTWTAVQLEFTDSEGNVDNGFRVSVGKKKSDGTKLPVKMWQRSVFQLMQPLLLSDKNYKAILDFDTVNMGNAAVVEALQVLVGKLKARVEKVTPEKEDSFAEYKFLKWEEELPFD